MNAALESAATPEPARTRLPSVADHHRMGEVGILAPDEHVELIEGCARELAQRSPETIAPTLLPDAAIDLSGLFASD